MLIPSRHVTVLPNPNFVFKDHKPFIGGQSHLNKMIGGDSIVFDFFVVPSRAGNRYDKRFGHFNYASLKNMSSMSFTQHLPAIDVVNEVCDVCQYGKQERLPFPINKAWRASEKLHLVHIDVCGPQKTQSLNGSRYFILFIDDFTRLCWVYFLKFKSEVAGVFQKFKALTENQVDCKIKVLRSDNGTEYTSNQFERFCFEAGIEHQLTVTYTPQQNGVVRGKIGLLWRWQDVYCLRRSFPKVSGRKQLTLQSTCLIGFLLKPCKNKIPFEAWYGVKPAVEHLRIFGCICYTHVPEVKRDKLDQRAEIGIFLGYSNNVKGYRVFNLKTKK